MHWYTFKAVSAHYYSHVLIMEIKMLKLFQLLNPTQL